MKKSLGSDRRFSFSRSPVPGKFSPVSPSQTFAGVPVYNTTRLPARSFVLSPMEVPVFEHEVAKQMYRNPKIPDDNKDDDEIE